MQDTVSVTGLKRSLYAAHGVRAACWNGTKKRSGKKQSWVEAGVNEKGYCVLRWFKKKEDEEYAGEYNVMGPNIELRRIENLKDKVFRFGFILRGGDLTNEHAKPLSGGLYIYTTTSREDSLIQNAVRVLIMTALRSGMCRFSRQVNNTFQKREPMVEEGTPILSRTVGADIGNYGLQDPPVPGRGNSSEMSTKAQSERSLDTLNSETKTRERSNSGASLSSTGSAARRMSSMLKKNPFSRSKSTRTGKNSSSNAAAAAAAAATISSNATGSNGSSSSTHISKNKRKNNHDTAYNNMSAKSNPKSTAKKTTIERSYTTKHFNSQKPDLVSSQSTGRIGGTQQQKYQERNQLDAREKQQLTTIVQCCWFLNDITHLKEMILFKALPEGAKEESDDLVTKLSNGNLTGSSGLNERPALGTSAADVVADVLSVVLLQMNPGLIRNDEFARYDMLVEKQLRLGIEPHLSPTSTSSASNLIGSMDVERRFALREIISLIKLVTGTSFTLQDASQLFGNLLVAEKRKHAVRTSEYPHGIVSKEDSRSIKVLFQTLLNDLTGPGIFDSHLSSSDALAKIKHLTRSIPKHLVAQDDANDANNGIESSDPVPEMWKDAAQDDDDEIMKKEAYEPIAIKESPNSEKPIDYLSLASAVDLDSGLEDAETKDSTAKTQQDKPSSASVPPPPITQFKTEPKTESRKEESVKTSQESTKHNMAAAIGAGALAATVATAAVSAGSTVSISKRNAASENPTLKKQGNVAAATVTATTTFLSPTSPPALTPSTSAPQSQVSAKAQDTSKHMKKSQEVTVEKKERMKTLRKLIQWYESRLKGAPNARNAPLWKREIHELERELDELEGKASRNPLSISDLMGQGAQMDKMFLSSIAKCWDRAQHSSADSLMKRAQSERPTSKRLSHNSSSFDYNAKFEKDPYLRDPLIALDDSDKLLEKLMMDIDSLGKQHNRNDIREPKSPILKEVNKLNDTSKNDPMTLMLGLLMENVEMRIELNEYQRGIVQRTQEKALEFQNSFRGLGNGSANGRNGNANANGNAVPIHHNGRPPTSSTSSLNSTSNSNSNSTPPRPPQSTWSSLASIF